MNQPERDSILLRVREILVKKFKLSTAEVNKLDADARLIDGSLGLDSLDALELAMCVEEEFGVTIECREESHRVFSSIGNLADFLVERTRPEPLLQPAPMDVSDSADKLGWPSAQFTHFAKN